MQPLAIVLYERIMPGSQLVNRLQDLNYRVLVLNNPALVTATARREMPLVVFTDLETRGDVCDAITRIKTDEATRHLPIVAFAPDTKTDVLAAAQKAGASLVVGETILSEHLPTLLEQALQVD
jgi:CheY-like chemotaxis protein